MKYVSIDGPINSQQLGSQMGNIAMLYTIAKKTGHRVGIAHSSITTGHGQQLIINGFNSSAIDIINDNIIPTHQLPLFLDPDVQIPYDVSLLDPNFNYNFHGGLFHWVYLYHLNELNNFKNELFMFKKQHIEDGNSRIHKFNSGNKKLVSIHFRRTDYLTCGAHNLTNDYYEAALSNFDDSYKILVFSDDMEFCKTELNDLFKDRDTWFSENTNRYIDMYIMSQCDANINANSTFSTWGALLNESKNLMIYPEYMFPISMKDMYNHISKHKNILPINIK
jgi:hypothetical protein